MSEDKFQYNMDDFVESFDGVTKSVGNYIGRTFKSFDTNTSITSDFNRSDYERFRPSFRIPKSPRKIIADCMDIYEDNGLVHNIIDLMSEFGCDGIHITHPVPSIQRFYQKWFNHINGYSVSERFLNYLYRSGNVFCRRKSDRIPKKTINEWKRAFGISEDVFPELKRREIPYNYKFLNPSRISVISKKGEQIKYGLDVGYDVINDLLRNQTVDLHPDVKKAVKGGNSVPLGDDVVKYFYKKDDWREFANPMIYPIMQNLLMLKKMHLADISALDGAISNVRLWKLGVYNQSNPAASITPTTAGLNKLRDLLHNRGTGGTIDLVWDYTLDFKESSTDVHKFLGKEKYEQCIMEIYAGLGIPLSLVGMIGSSENGTHSFMSLQTLVKRLEYGRALLKDFWMKEIKAIQKSMGFAKCADIRFSASMLNDEGVRNELLLSLVDRNIISDETVRNEVGFSSDLEHKRVMSEQNKRDKDTLPKKAGPYHNPQTDEALKEIILRNGGVAPSELGIELMERKPGEETLFEATQLKLAEQKGAQNLPKPEGKNGRPSNSKDKQKRKQKTIASDFINMFIWGKAAQDAITEDLTDFFKSHFNKKNIRSLTSEEKSQAERFKFKLFASINPYAEITKEMVYNTLRDGIKPNIEIENISTALLKQFIQENGRQPTYEELKDIKASAFAVYHLGED